MANRDWITNDLGWKLFSLILAVALWITVHNIRETPEAVTPFATVNTVIFTNLPVLAVSASADVRAARIVPDVITVKLSGPSNVMAVLQENRVHATVDLTGIDSARHFPRRVDVSPPPGVALDKIDPPEVSVTITRTTE